MASESWPHAAHNSGAVTTTEWEQQAALGLGSGLVGTTADTPVVYADGVGTRVVKLRAEKRAVVRGAAWYSGAADISLPALSANTSGTTRIDRVVLRLTKASGVVAETVIEGTAGAGAPALIQNTGTTGVWDLPLAQVTVANGATTLAAGTVTAEGWYLGQQPVVATSATYPTGGSAPAGLLVWDTGGKLLVSDGATRRLVYEDAGKSNLSAATGWSIHASGAFVRRRSGQVQLTGWFTRTGVAFSVGAQLLTTLPAGFRPAEPIFVQAYLQGSFPALAQLSIDGRLELWSYAEPTATGRYVAVPAVTFQAA